MWKGMKDLRAWGGRGQGLTGFFPPLWDESRDQEGKRYSCGVWCERKRQRGERQRRPRKVVYFSVPFFQSVSNPSPFLLARES